MEGATNMKQGTKALNLGLVAVVCLLIAFGFVVTGHCQTYFVSTPVSGYCSVDVMNFDGQPTGRGAGFFATFGTLNETLYYDSVANTLRQVGSITVSPTSTVNLQFAAMGQMVGTNWLTAQVSVSLQLAGPISFETPAKGGNLSAFSFPVTGSWTLDTGGDEYTGPLNYSLEVWFTTEISSVTSTSLTFSQRTFMPHETGPSLGGVIASNRFRLNLRGGIGDGTYDTSWSVGPVTAVVVPEPSTWSMLAMGAVGLLGGLRLRRRSS
jgi:hypothetical protein